MKLIAAIGFFGGMAGSAVFAQSDGIPTPSPAPESVLVNKKLAAKVEEVERASLHLKSEDEGLAFMSLGAHSYAEKTQFIFFRRRGTRLQMIATGAVQGERENPKDRSRELVLNIDQDSIVKYPQVGDIAVPIADPMSTALGEKRENSNTPVVEAPQPHAERLPGYLQAGGGIFFGKLASDGDPQVGGGKNSQSYRFQNLDFEYFSGIFPFGIQYQTHGGNLPTSTYNGIVVSSRETVTHLNFYYRFFPVLNKKLYLNAKIFLLSDDLTTDNTGSELFTTKISAPGIGLRAQYHFSSDVWKPRVEKGISIQPLNLFADFGFSPMVSAQDASPSRGTQSSGSSLLEYHVGATMLAWVNFIPVLKRWVFQASYGARKYNLSFQGTTVSEVGNPIQVPQNVKTNESESDYRFFIGVRFVDPIASIFGDDDKEKGGKK